jgi:hypothetical protein
LFPTFYSKQEKRHFSKPHNQTFHLWGKPLSSQSLVINGMSPFPSFHSDPFIPIPTKPLCKAVRLNFMLELFLVQINESQFFVFHERGISVYDPATCRTQHQIQGTDIIPGTQVKKLVKSPYNNNYI